MSKTLKFGIFLLVLFCLILLVITLVDLPFNRRPFVAAEQGGLMTSNEPGDPDLVRAVEAALMNAEGHWAVFDYQVDHIQVQDDGQMALVWLLAIDPEFDEVLGREPELALATKDLDGGWRVLLQNDPAFDSAFKSCQYTEKHLQGDLVSEPQAMPKSGQVFGGYYLPWAEGLEKRLTWSVGHSSCSPVYYCTHAFDFADGTMFPLLAAKGGTVYHWKDSCINHDSTCTNSITIEDRSTTPWTYQIYLHMAHNSIPSNLKKVGTPVLQGQFIGNVDNTGFSTGHHVHFMVVSARTKYMSWRGYVFGVAEDITFRDVDINWHAPTQGGRPRLAYEAASYGGEGRSLYVSGNKPAFPPTGGLTAPANKTYVTNRNLTVKGWGEDDIAVVKMEILAEIDGKWVQVGQEQTANPFTTTVDLCQTNIPNGPFRLALRVWDYEGNPSGIMTPRKLVKNVQCGTSATNPNVTLIRNGGTLALPQQGFVSATVAPGSTGSAINSVEFWFHGRNWNTGNWVYLGKDTNGSNGWQAAINTRGMTEAGDYTILAVATDNAGNKGVDVAFNAIVDATPPWINIVPFKSPIMTSSVTLSWTGGDNRSGLDYYSLAVRVNDGTYQTVAFKLPASTTSYFYPVSREQLVVFALTAYDKSGNATTQKVGLYTDGYVFPYNYTFPIFFNGN